MKYVATTSFQAPLAIDNGFYNTPISKDADHSFELFMNEDQTEGMVEWVAEVEGHDEDEFVTHIGLWLDGNENVFDYDGVFELPKQLTDWLVELGYKVEDVLV